MLKEVCTAVQSGMVFRKWLDGLGLANDYQLLAGRCICCG